MNRLKWFVLGVPAFILLIQLFGPGKTNPPLDPSQEIEAHLTVPTAVSEIFERACQNCHSHKTLWPWYSSVAPVSWFVIDHVNFGRRRMNLSKWGEYRKEEVLELLEEMCEMVKEGEMPLAPYLWMHEEAHLSAKDVEAMCRWSEEQRASVGNAG